MSRCSFCSNVCRLDFQYNIKGQVNDSMKRRVRKLPSMQHNRLPRNRDHSLNEGNYITMFAVVERESAKVLILILCYLVWVRQISCGKEHRLSCQLQVNSPVIISVLRCRTVLRKYTHIHMYATRTALQTHTHTHKFSLSNQNIHIILRNHVQLFILVHAIMKLLDQSRLSSCETNAKRHE